MDIRSLEKTTLEQLLNAWALAFQDYPYQWTADELMRMLIRRGYVPSLSFGAFDNDKLVAFTLNGFGDYNNTLTAYDTGTGTIPEYRNRGLAAQIFKAAAETLNEAGARQYILEVLSENAAAISVYNKLGFTVCRNFNYMIHQASKIKFPDKVTDGNISIEVIEWHDENIAGYLSRMKAFCDFSPSWQNMFDAILRSPGSFVLLAAFQNADLVGYAVVNGSAGDIAQLAVDRSHRRKGIGARLFKIACAYCATDRIQVINTDARDTAITAFLAAHNMPVTGAQFEMVLALN